MNLIVYAHFWLEQLSSKTTVTTNYPTRHIVRNVGIGHCVWLTLQLSKVVNTYCVFLPATKGEALDD